MRKAAKARMKLQWCLLRPPKKDKDSFSLDKKDTMQQMKLGR